jgi:hypothetical protein
MDAIYVELTPSDILFLNAVLMRAKEENIDSKYDFVGYTCDDLYARLNKALKATDKY